LRRLGREERESGTPEAGTERMKPDDFAANEPVGLMAEFIGTDSKRVCEMRRKPPTGAVVSSQGREPLGSGDV
jgi:hypothetical protein